MLSDDQVRQIERLFAVGVGQRAISRRTGIARETVRKILNGQRPDYAAIRKAQAEEEPPLFVGKPQRCPACGAMVYLPCLGCRIRRKVEAEEKVRRYKRTLQRTA